jgi:hypothetical protein
MTTPRGKWSEGTAVARRIEGVRKAKNPGECRGYRLPNPALPSTGQRSVRAALLRRPEPAVVPALGREGPMGESARRHAASQPSRECGIVQMPAADFTEPSQPATTTVYAETGEFAPVASESGNCPNELAHYEPKLRNCEPLRTPRSFPG